MQLSIELSRTQIHIAGQGMIRLNRAGRCVGFAESYRNAELRADQLDRYFALKAALDRLAVDTTGTASFGFGADDPGFESAGTVTSGEWLVVGLIDVDLIPIKRFAHLADAERFADELRRHNRFLPESDVLGEWSADQWEWWQSHPAQFAALCTRVYISPVQSAKGMH